MNQTIAVVLIVAGGVLIGVGLLAYAGLLSWFGQLPGDIHFESGQTHVYIPITSMIVVSLALTVILNVLRKLFG